MGIELIRVPANWEHPTDSDYSRRDSSLAYQPPRHDKWRPITMRLSWDGAMRAWWWERISRGFQRAVAYWPSVLGLIEPPHAVRWQFDETAPTPYEYRPRWRERDRTCFQLYETVSEGTPISPVCASLHELAEWCALHPNVWVGTETMDLAAWQRFFSRGGWAPSAIVTPEHGFEAGVKATSR